MVVAVLLLRKYYVRCKFVVGEKNALLNDASEYALGNIVYTPFNMDIAYVSLLFFTLYLCVCLSSSTSLSLVLSFYVAFHCFQLGLSACHTKRRQIYHRSRWNPLYFSIKWLQLQRHRHEMLQDVVLMTFVIWNSYVLLPSGGSVWKGIKRHRRWKFSLCAWTCLHFADFQLFIIRSFHNWNFVQTFIYCR